jgi:hypothetical protein
VTWEEPVAVPIIPAVTPLPAVAFPFAITGGQRERQLPLQLLLFVLSASKRYSVFPSWSTRIVPSGELAALTVTAVAELEDPPPPP